MLLTLRKELFWDIAESQIADTIEASPSWVILRVFQYGELSEIADVIDHYGKEQVNDVLVKGNLKPMSKAMAFYFLDLDL